MISAGDFRKDLTFEKDGDVYEVAGFQHVKPGKGVALVRAKIRSVLSGGIKDTTLNPSEKFEKATIQTKEMQYLCNDGALYYFMDNETYEQIPLGGDIVREAMNLIRENDNATINFYRGKPFNVSAANFVELEVAFTEPGVKGDTSSGGIKSTTIETGFKLNVPLFVSIGDVIRTDIRDGEYMSRVQGGL